MLVVRTVISNADYFFNTNSADPDEMPCSVSVLYQLS